MSLNSLFSSMQTMQLALANQTAPPRLVRVLDMPQIKYVMQIADQFSRIMPRLPPVFATQEKTIFAYVRGLQLIFAWLKEQRRNYDAGDVGVIAP